MDTSTHDEFTKAMEKSKKAIKAVFEKAESDKKDLEAWRENTQKQDALPRKERKEEKESRIKEVQDQLKAMKELWNRKLKKNVIFLFLLEN